MSVYELVIHLTQQCPLKCRHCCVESSPTKKVHLDLELALRAIEDVADIATMKMVSFVGGEPFLVRDSLTEAVGYAANKGLMTSTVTSAYWATSQETALRVLTPLKEAGLSRISLSYDDAHAEFVDERNLVFAYRAARQLDLSILVPVAVEPDARITAESMTRLLGIGPKDSAFARVYEFGVNSTGRARARSDEDRRIARRRGHDIYRGHCKSVLRQASVHPDGKIAPCCGVIPYRDELRIADLRETGVGAAMDEAAENPLLRWIALEGPVSILKQVTADEDRPLEDTDFDGICHACDELFSNQRYLDLVKEALPRKMPALELQEALYAQLGLPSSARNVRSRRQGSV